MVQEEAKGFVPQNLVTFEFPIYDRKCTTQMNNITPFDLPHFRGISNEDPDTFHFEFDVLCCS